MVLATISMVACMNEEITEMPNGGEISFDNAFVENSTRAELNKDNLADFAVWAYAEEPQNVVFAGEEVEKTNGVWGYQGKQYWLPGKTYYFAAVAPYDGNWSNAVVDGGKLESVNFTNDGNVDLLYATANQVGKSANEGNSAVQFTFSHILSKVKFNFMNGLVTNQGNNKIIVKNVTMKVAETATWNGSAWSSLDGEVALNFGSTGDAAIALNDDADTKALFVIPSSDVFDISFDVEVYFGNNSNVAYTKAMNSTVTGIELVKGHAYNFTAVITPETLNLGDIEFDADVEEWIPGGDVTPVVGQSIKTSEELVAAFAQGGEFVLADNFNLADGQSLVVPAGKTVVLNLNGYSISQVKEQSGVYALIENNGTLEIINSGATIVTRSGNGGAIIYKDNATLSGDVDYTSNTILNNGELTVNEGVTIVNESSATVAQFGYPLVINTKGKLTVNGGTFTNSDANSSAISIWASDDASQECEVVINGGTFNGSVDMHADDSNANGSLTINGGDFNGKVSVENEGNSTESSLNVTINGGSYETDNYTDEELEALKSYFVEGSVSSTENGQISIIEGLVCDANGNYHVSSAAALFWVSEQVNTMEYYVSGAANIFDNKTVYVTADIDLQGAEWRPIGDYAFSRTSFNGVFDGQGHTISNFKVTKKVVWTEKVADASYGFFGNVKGTVKNLTIKNATVTPEGGKFAAALIGRLHAGATVDNCHVIDSSATSLSWQVGGLVAQSNGNTITNCSVTGTTVSGLGAAGALVGMIMTAGEYTIDNCHVSGCTLVQNVSSESYKMTFGVAVGLVNTAGAIVRINDVVAENNTIRGEASNTLVGEIETGAQVSVNGNYTVTDAKSLIAAVNNIKDGGIISLVADVNFTEEDRTLNSGWYDGVYYVGDQSFTIDLNGHTIGDANSVVNDYLLNFKNDGAKANTITIKNGIVNAGTTAYCALCSSSLTTQNMTINLEDIELYNKNSNGSCVKIRGDKVTLNVNKGTKITGLDSYLAIECVAATTNIYDGAEIYMTKTSSYNGCLVGVCNNGVVNTYGGYGNGVKGCFIAMTSGGTINISGGEWIANTDGTIGNNSNLYVLTAQSNSYESGYAGGSYINVSGGTFRGGMDAWVLNANKPEEDAGLSISGGNFNANPTHYLAAGHTATEVDGIWTVE